MLGTFAFVCGVTPLSYAQIPCQYQVSHIIQAPPCPFVGPPPTVGTAISPDGRYVCGSYSECFTAGSKAFVYDRMRAEFFTLPNPPGISTAVARDVSDAGFVVGEHGGSAGDFGFIYDIQGGEYMQLPPLHPDGICSANAINASGTVCGTRTLEGPPQYRTTAYLWSEKQG